MRAYRYIREFQVIEVFDLDEMLEKQWGEESLVSVAAISEAMPKWLGLEVLEGPLPEVDFSYDQLRWELEIAVQVTEDMNAVGGQWEQALPKCMSAAFERFKTRLHPSMEMQRLRLNRMKDFMNAVENVTEDERLIVGPELDVMYGSHVLAKAIMEGKEYIGCYKLESLGLPTETYKMDVWVTAEQMENLVGAEALSS